MTGPALVIVDGVRLDRAPVGPLAGVAGWDLDEGRGCFTTGRVVQERLSWEMSHVLRLVENAKALGAGDEDLAPVLSALAAASVHALMGVEQGTFRMGVFQREQGLSWVLTLEGERRTWCDDSPLSLSIAPRQVLELKDIDRRVIEAIPRGVGDGIAFGDQERVFEGDWFNLFAYQAGSWATPIGVFAGLTRQRLITALGERVQLIDVDGLSLETLSAADAVVATSALAGVVPVRQVGGCRCGWTDAGAAAVEELRSML